MSMEDFMARKGSMEALQQSLRDHIEAWVAANCEDNKFWSEAWFAHKTPERMTDAAWAVFMSSRDGQRFAEEQK